MARKKAAQGEPRDEPIKVFVTVDDLRVILKELAEPIGEPARAAIERIEDSMLLALKADAIEYR